MAWLQNIAGKAENLLNQLDKNAANVLNENPVTPEKKFKEDSTHEDTKATTSTIHNLQNEASNLEVNMDLLSFEESSKNEETSSPSDPNPGSWSDDENNLAISEEVALLNEKITKVETNNQDLSKQVLNLQHQLSEYRNDNSNLKSQIESLDSVAKAAALEIEQYKARAHRVLQEKEDLIALKNQPNNEENTYNTLYKYNQELKEELAFQHNKNKELMDTLDRSKQDAGFLRQQIVSIQKTSHETNQSLENILEGEKKLRRIAEQEYQVKSDELHKKEQEVTHLHDVVKLNNGEIASLKEALRQRTNCNINDNFEMRIKSLTETLMTKQSSLELVTTERNALRIQLEKLENEYHNNLTQLERTRTHVVNVNDTDDVKSQVPQFMRVSPLDAGVTRRVKHAYSTLDEISIKTGIILRRYPVARVFLLCYVILLHLWVLVILFLYAPIIH